MKLSHLFFSDKPDIRWDLCAQMGIRYAVAKLAPELTGKKPIWDFESLREAKDNFASHGFDLVALEGDQFDMTRIKLGLPGREEDAEHYRQMLHNMGKLGITTLCYNFMQTGWFRTSKDLRERGGALVTGFDCSVAGTLPDKEYAPVGAERVWDNYLWFLNEVLPTAEEAGVKMGLHPDDPPYPCIEGVDRIFISPESIDRALSICDSPSHCLTFCQGTYKTMGVDIPSVFHRWHERISFIHIRDVEGDPSCFHETFHDNGPTDMPAMLKMYDDEGFDGLIRSDHVPTMAGEDNSRPSYSMNGTLFGVGYIKGILDTLKIYYQ
ncbi:MAG: mannonate dehydratase [Bacteroidales bacterium]|nr:mannonate dehydratase [Bacteroidales bacterium]